MSTDEAQNSANDTQRRRKRRWGDASATPAEQTTPPQPQQSAPPLDGKAKALALQASIREKLAALKAKTAAVPTTAGTPIVASSSSTKRPPSEDAASAPSTKRAKHYELDLTTTAPTFNKKPEPPKPKVNPYLAHSQAESNEETGEETQDVDQVDERVQAAKTRQRHKSLKFVEPGTFVEIAERKRRKAANAEQSGFVSGRKAATYFNAQTMANIYGPTPTETNDDDPSLLPTRAEANVKTTMPYVLEWWDLELLPSELKKQVTSYEGKALQKENENKLKQFESNHADTKSGGYEDVEALELQTTCFKDASLSYSKTAALVQHIVPVKPPNAKDGPPVEPTLYLTKKELKRQRKLRRQEKQRELQDLQAAGLVPAPEPRLTLQNFIKVLGDQAFVDPSQMEQKVLHQMEARQRAHVERNEKNKLTKEQRAAKLAKKLQEDTSEAVNVALFYVKDMSHPYHRTKVDLNAQQSNITGGVLECGAPQLACVICEGGPKAIKRFTRLMTVRMKWQGPDDALDEEDEEEEDKDPETIRPKFNKENTCSLVWTGMATKRFFKGFVFQSCESGSEAASVLRSKGVGHYWDQLLAHVSGKGDRFQLRLAESDDDEDDEMEVEGGQEDMNAE